MCKGRGCITHQQVPRGALEDILTAHSAVGYECIITFTNFSNGLQQPRAELVSESESVNRGYDGVFSSVSLTGDKAAQRRYIA